MLGSGRRLPNSGARSGAWRRGRAHRATLPFGVPALDRHLPGGGLALGAVHEMAEGGPAGEFAGAATLFVAGIAARL